MVATDSRYAEGGLSFCAGGIGQSTRKCFGSPANPGTCPALNCSKVCANSPLNPYGKRAKATLNGWGIFKCEDFGEIVFNLIEAGLLIKQEKDSKADFHGGYDFDTAFPS